MTQDDNPTQDSHLLQARLRTFSNKEQLDTTSLILSAAGISHRIEITATQQIVIFVSVTDLLQATEELQKYDEENHNWPPSPHSDNFMPIFRALSPIVAAALIYVYHLSGEWSIESTWFIAGAGDSAAVLTSHEYYRLITALTLHADAVHLMSNCFLGCFLLHFLLLSLGNGIGIFSVLISSTVANFINVYIRGPGHHFVGFSTAVFVVIGMLCTIRFADNSNHRAFRVIMPIMAGFALLAFLGSSGERTDLGAHLFGLLTGLFAGNIVTLPKFTQWRDSTGLQFTLVLLTAIIIWASWASALTA